MQKMQLKVVLGGPNVSRKLFLIAKNAIKVPNPKAFPYDRNPLFCSSRNFFVPTISPITIIIKLKFCKGLILLLLIQKITSNKIKAIPKIKP